jgi:hypothetical protein
MDCNVADESVPLSEIPLPPNPPRSLEDQVDDLFIVYNQLKDKLKRYGRGETN